MGKSFPIIALLLAVGLFFYTAYKAFLTEAIFQSLTAEEAPSYIPAKVMNRIEQFKKPVNDGAYSLLSTMKQSNISMKQIFDAIDDADEDKALAMLDELNNTKIKDPNQVFDIAKKHFPVDFNVEVFRPVFNQHVDMIIIKKGLNYANAYKETNSLEAETAKVIAKKILKQKQKEFETVLKD